MVLAGSGWFRFAGSGWLQANPVKGDHKTKKKRKKAYNFGNYDQINAYDIQNGFPLCVCIFV